MTGRLQPGDRVNTPDGPGTILSSYMATGWLSPGTWYAVRLDEQDAYGHDKGAYRGEQLEFLSRQLALPDSSP